MLASRCLSLLLFLLPLTPIDPRPCDFDPRPKSVWRYCDCTPVTYESGKVFCRHVSWINIPTLPLSPGATISPHFGNASRGTTQEEDSATVGVYRMSSLSIIESGLVFIEQDSFKGQNIQLLDLSHNQILTINVNAFRGLEAKLYQLSLNHNSLQAVPSQSLTYLHQLQYLYLRDNHIASVPLSTFQEKQLKSLRFLYLDNNLITDVYTGAFSPIKLQVLTLGNNRIVQIESGAFPNSLWFLNLKNNALNEIPLESLTNLKRLSTLDLEGNNITRISPNPFGAKFQNDMNLLLSNNRIRTIDPEGLANFESLKVLDLSYNQLESVPEAFLKNVTKLEKLDLSHNSMANIPEKAFVRLFGMRELNLEENKFHALPLALQPLLNLEKLNLNSNKLTYLSNETIRNFKTNLRELRLGFNSLAEVPTNALDGMPQLQFLDLSKNKIRELRRLAFGDFNGAGTTLVRLNLAGNDIVSIHDPGSFLYMSSLAYLDLSHNKIQELGTEAFSRLGGLESLFLQNNQLRAFPSNALHKLEKLRYLILDDNRIMAIPPEGLMGLSQLEQLSCRRNDLYAISADAFPSQTLKNLKAVNLAQNHIIHIAPKAFHNLSSLEIVNLARNSIPSINAFAFQHLPNVRRIVLSWNKINATYQSAFVGLPRLETLDLSHNSLDRIDDGTFRDVAQLENLDLSHNRFESFNLDFLKHTKSLGFIDLSYNKLSHENPVDLSRYLHTLTTIKLRKNAFHDVGNNLFSGFTKLRSLDLSGNDMGALSSRAFLSTPMLTDLDLSQNYIQRLQKKTFNHQEIFASINLNRNRLSFIAADTFGLDNVYSLNLGRNRFEAIPYTGLNSVRNSLAYLDLSHNHIKSLESKHFNGLGNLSTLILSHNQIQSIEKAAFRGLHKLRHLDLSHNPVTSWHPLVFQDLGHSLDLLNLADTGLFRLPKINPRGIRHLNLSLNRVHDLSSSDLAPLSKLRTLDISHNKISQLDPEMFHSVKDLLNLNLSHNPFSSLSPTFVKSLHKLRSLRVHNLENLNTIPESEDTFWYLRHLREFHFHTIPSLATSQANLTKILSFLPPLRSLHIEIFRDRILNKQLHAADSRFLRDIMVTGRGLEEIHPSAFQFLRGYRVKLKIWNTRVTEFPPAALNLMSRVNYLDLDLSHNQLHSFEPYLYTDPPIINLHGTILANLNLRDNSLSCDCRLKWIGPWFRYLKRDLAPQIYNKREQAWARTSCHQIEDAVKSRRIRTDLDFGRMGCSGAGSREDASAVSLLAIHFVLFILSILDYQGSSDYSAATTTQTPAILDIIDKI